VAAAVILDPARPIPGLADSKALSAARRARLFDAIMQGALAWSIARASAAEIDQHNILQASLLAMRRAVDGLGCRPAHVLMDGNRLPSWDYSSEAVVRGDATVASISAASILAKVARDRDMLELHQQYPQYGFDRHKGYPTAQHLSALAEHGVTPFHRRSFAPVRDCLLRHMTGPADAGARA